MKKLLLLGILCIALLGVLVSGCSSQSDTVNTTDTTGNDIFVPPGAHDDVIDNTIDWDIVRYTCDIFTTSDDFAELIEASLIIDENDKIISYRAIIADDADPFITVGFADVILRTINDSVAEQVTNIAFSGTDTYGGIYEEFSYSIEIMPTSTKDDVSTWFVNVNHSAGSPYSPIEVPDYYINMEYAPV
jgi:hypothetical protein